MTTTRTALLGMFLGFIVALQSGAALASDKISLGVRASLQATVQQYIDDHSVEGVYLYLDQKNGEVRGLHPVKAHPTILTMGEHFVLCYDFRDKAGTKANLDLYLARKGDGYTVFHTSVDDRKLLKKMMKSGKVRMAR